MTPEQARAAEEFRTLRGVDPFGPFIPLLKSPELMTRVSALGEYLRYRSALPPRLSELAILITAAHWQQQFEWEIHAPVALTAGIPQSVIDALWSRQSPTGLDAEQRVLYDLCVSVHQDRVPTSDLVARAEAILGEQATVDAIRDLRVLRPVGDGPEFLLLSLSIRPAPGRRMNRGRDNQ